MNQESFPQSDSHEGDAEKGLESAIREASSLEGLAELIGKDETLSDIERKSSLKAIEVLRDRPQEERGSYLTSPGCVALREHFPQGLQEKLAELIGPATPREAHDFGKSDRSVDLDR